MDNRDLEHPVWEVYGLLRTARLNFKYYSVKLDRMERLNFIFQIVIAAALPSSTFAGYEIWKTGTGSTLWGVLLIVASVFAFLQPFLKLTDKIKKYDAIVNGYHILDFDMQELRAKISNSRNYTKAHHKLYEAALKRKKAVGVKESGIKLDKSLRDKCTVEVGRELPSKNFYIPEE
jgi:hypothetical protein